MKFHYLARAIIFKNGKVLLAHQKGAENTFLPGGHIELGEKAEAVLVREIAEELGEEAWVKQFLGAVECIWAENGEDNHEINLIFEVILPDIDPNQPPISRESHLEFIWAEPTNLKEHNLLPRPMVECIQDRDNGYHAFWGSSH